MQKKVAIASLEGIPNHTLHSAAHMHGLRIRGGFAGARREREWLASSDDQEGGGGWETVMRC